MTMPSRIWAEDIGANWGDWGVDQDEFHSPVLYLRADLAAEMLPFVRMVALIPFETLNPDAQDADVVWSFAIRTDDGLSKIVSRITVTDIKKARARLRKMGESDVE